MRLSNKSLQERSSLDTGVSSYPRDQLEPGIVHLGLGAFHRAHQAVFTERVVSSGDLRWGIVGVSLRSSDTAEALSPQDCLYSVCVRDSEKESIEVIRALVACHVAPTDTSSILTAMTDSRCHLVSLTITEKGYFRSPANGDLLADDAAVRYDIENISAPRTAIGFIVRALALRCDAGVGPFTVLSCDNLPANGDATRKVVLQLAHEIDPELAKWIADEVAFPNTMVDRIVPKTSDADKIGISDLLGLVDAWPVVTEPFSQWVIEDRFCAPRPMWETVGATLVNDVGPYESAKLRMLNASHSALAYLGLLAGYRTVDEAVQQPDIAHLILTMLRQEVEPTLSLPGLSDYRKSLLNRFNNVSLKHTLQQIAMDGSQKIPQRWLTTISACISDGIGVPCLTFALAGWIAYLRKSGSGADSDEVNDPLFETLMEAVIRVPADVAVTRVLNLGMFSGQMQIVRDHLSSDLICNLQQIEKAGVIRALSSLDI